MMIAIDMMHMVTTEHGSSRQESPSMLTVQNMDSRQDTVLISTTKRVSIGEIRKGIRA
jgi:hypothetical protein